jgi:aminoacyl tRNA synthase complex-interacting multifunctional protein 1
MPSNGMILAASDASHEKVELLVAPEGAVVGERVRFGASDEPQSEPQTPNQIQKKKTWEELQPLLVTDASCVATYKGAPMMTSAGPVKCASLVDASIG